MSNKSPLLNIIFQSLNKVTRNVLRDFGEPARAVDAATLRDVQVFGERAGRLP